MPIFIVIGLLVLILAAVPVAVVLWVLSFVLDETLMQGRLMRAIGDIYWEKSTDFVLLSVPLFILLGEIVLRAGIAARMYGAVSSWLTWLPGGLMHANIGTCSLFAATSGSSVATTATVGTVAYPEIERSGYNERLFLGSLAAGGTLGILIPPSISLILYGVLTGTSIPELYLAGLIPGVLLALLFIAIIVCVCVVRPDWGGLRVKTTRRDRLRSIPDLAAPAALFVAVVGSIYMGIATPSEAASVGVVMALLLAALYRSLSWKMLLSAFESTMQTTAMILMIVFAALFLNFVLGFVGVTNGLLNVLSAMDMSPKQTIAAIVVLFLVLGMFMETLSMMLITVPVLFPVVAQLGVAEYSGVWFGILVTLLMEAALITPPIGLNLYVAQGIRKRGGRFGDVAIGALPFVLPMLALIFLLIAFPGIATWLPDAFYR